MKKYDVCIIAFVDIATDARTLNISDTFAKHSYKVAVIGTGSICPTHNSNIDYYQFPIDSDKRTWKRWIEFYKKSKEIIQSIITKNVFAEDVYSLAIASRLAKQYNTKLIYDSREIYSAIGSLSGKSFKQRIIATLEKYYIANVSRIIVTGERDRSYLQQHLSNSIPYTIIKNLPPNKERIETDIIRNKFNLSQDTRIIVYQGMLLTGRGIEKTIEAVANIDNCAFVILGDGPLREHLAKLINNKKMSHKVFLAGAIEYSNLHQWTSSADLGISLIEPVSKSYELALPNKLFEYIMAGIPTLCSDLPAMREIVEQYNIGKSISYDMSMSEIEQAIKELLDSKSEYARNCHKAAKQLSFERQDKDLLKTIEE